MAVNKQFVSSGTVWESSVGYSRAVRVGDMVFVSGTTATGSDGATVAPGDAAAQTEFILSRIEGALSEVGASLQDVVRTRMFVTDIQHWEAIGQVHGRFFGEIRPAATMVEVSRLISDDQLIEIEVDACITSSG